MCATVVKRLCGMPASPYDLPATASATEMIDIRNANEKCLIQHCARYKTHIGPNIGECQNNFHLSEVEMELEIRNSHRFIFEHFCILQILYCNFYMCC